jgi:glyoxylase-like metal-dependent hydrolase (beta-lactamase superfamily II)
LYIDSCDVVQLDLSKLGERWANRVERDQQNSVARTPRTGSIAVLSCRNQFSYPPASPEWSPMKVPLTCVLLFCVVLDRFAASGAAAESPTPLAPDVTIRQLAPDVWMHTSLQRYPGGIVIPSNGLLVVKGNDSILIDTAWNDAQTQRIFDFAAATLQKPVRRAIVTHAHNDRIGGVGFLLSRNIPVSGLTLTRDIAIARNVAGPNDTFDLGIGQTRQLEGIELFYPGPGHAPDNIVVWIPSDRLLFGGCLVKSADADNLGFTGDADLNRWPDTVRTVSGRYSSATVVVPGHGAPGDIHLLDHTLKLLAENHSTTRPTKGELLH